MKIIQETSSTNAVEWVLVTIDLKPKTISPKKIMV